MAKVVPPRLVTRGIYFFRLNGGVDSRGVPIPVDLAPSVLSIDGLPFAAGSRRYWIQPGGDAIALWANGPGSYDRFSLAIVRRSAYPQTELNGALTPLALAAGVGLHEPIHVRLFPDNIVGVEFNFYGPRPTRLPGYFQYALPGSQDFVIEALLRQDAKDQLDKQSGLRLLDLQIKSAYAADVLQATKTLGKMFGVMSTGSNAEVIGLLLRPDRNELTLLPKKIMTGVRKLAGAHDLPGNALRFRAKGVNATTGRTDLIDFLDDKLISRQKIVAVGPQSQAVDSTAAYAAIEQAHTDLLPQLLVATGISQQQSAPQLLPVPPQSSDGIVP